MPLKLHKSLIAVVLGFSLLSSCTNPETIEKVVNVPVYPKPPIIPKVDTVNLHDISWIVVTPDNFQSVLARLRDEGQEPILYALTAEGYVLLNNNMYDIMKVMRQQQQVIAVYKEWSYWDGNY